MLRADYFPPFSMQLKQNVNVRHCIKRGGQC